MFHFAFLLAETGGAHWTSSGPGRLRASLGLDYADDVRGKLKAGILETKSRTEGPLNTTESNKRKNRLAQIDPARKPDFRGCANCQQAFPPGVTAGRGARKRGSW